MRHLSGFIRPAVDDAPAFLADVGRAETHAQPAAVLLVLGVIGANFVVIGQNFGHTGDGCFQIVDQGPLLELSRLEFTIASQSSLTLRILVMSAPPNIRRPA